MNELRNGRTRANLLVACGLAITLALLSAPAASSLVVTRPALPSSPPAALDGLVNDGQWDEFVTVAETPDRGEDWAAAFGDPTYFRTYWETRRRDGMPLTTADLPEYARAWVGVSNYEIYVCDVALRGEGTDYPGYGGELVFVDATGNATCAMAENAAPSDPTNSSGVFSVAVTANWAMYPLPDTVVTTQIPVCTRDREILGIQHLGGLRWGRPGGGTPTGAGEAESVGFYGITTGTVGPLVLPGAFTQYVPEDGIGVMYAECDGIYNPTPTILAELVFAVYARVTPNL